MHVVMFARLLARLEVRRSQATHMLRRGCLQAAMIAIKAKVLCKPSRRTRSMRTYEEVRDYEPGFELVSHSTQR